MHVKHSHEPECSIQGSGSHHLVDNSKPEGPGDQSDAPPPSSVAPDAAAAAAAAAAEESRCKERQIAKNKSVFDVKQEKIRVRKALRTVRRA